MGEEEIHSVKPICGERRLPQKNSMKSSHLNVKGKRGAL